MSNPVERLHPALGLIVAVSKPHFQLLESKILGVIQKAFGGERRTKLYLHQQLEPSDPLKWQNQEGRKGQAFALGIQLQLWDHFPESWLVLAEKREREGEGFECCPAWDSGIWLVTQKQLGPRDSICLTSPNKREEGRRGLNASRCILI